MRYDSEFMRAFFIVPIDPVTHEQCGQPHSFTVVINNEKEFFDELNKAIESTNIVHGDGFLYKLEIFADEMYCLEEYLKRDGVLEMPE